MAQGGHNGFINVGLSQMGMDDYPELCPTEYHLNRQQDEHAKAEAERMLFEQDREKLYELFNKDDGFIDNSTMAQRDRMVERLRLWKAELADVKDDYSDPETVLLIRYLDYKLECLHEVMFHFTERLRIQQQRDAVSKES